MESARSFWTFCSLISPALWRSTHSTSHWPNGRCKMPSHWGTTSSIDPMCVWPPSHSCGLICRGSSFGIGLGLEHGPSLSRGRGLLFVSQAQAVADVRLKTLICTSKRAIEAIKPLEPNWVNNPMRLSVIPAKNEMFASPKNDAGEHAETNKENKNFHQLLSEALDYVESLHGSNSLPCTTEALTTRQTLYRPTVFFVKGAFGNKNATLLWDSGYSGRRNQTLARIGRWSRTDLGTICAGDAPFGSDWHVINPYSEPLWHGIPLSWLGQVGMLGATADKADVVNNSRQLDPKGVSLRSPSTSTGQSEEADAVKKLVQFCLPLVKPPRYRRTGVGEFHLESSSRSIDHCSERWSSLALGVRAILTDRIGCMLNKAMPSTKSRLQVQHAPCNFATTDV